ncbi:DUF883 family protein [Janthinobacterium fluminis]|uniref:DUF883 family protein n=1 Tax=Janthinobacterium fluminis TaxID=2987524 RepID=A0ABT5K450_9BURK|nr:DUF883 family protein [Janthinobacterium fluminis]MDC8759772.1 DUF883 family protein [Janthinobacterium fluminis]
MNSTHPSGNGGDSGAELNAHSGSDAREKLMNDMKHIIHEAEDWLSSGAAHSGEELQAVKERFEDTLRTAKTDLLRVEANMLAKTKLAAQATDTYVKDNPWKSVGLGAAVGIVFGLLISRR